MTSSPINPFEKPLKELVAFLNLYVRDHASCSKDELARATQQKFSLKKHRAVFVGDYYVVRFSEVKKPGGGFSNTVTSLKNVKLFNDVPIVAVLLRPSGIECFLANATFLKKISHSSPHLSEKKIVGNFNGSDIVRALSEIKNCPENFDELFDIHQSHYWEDSFRRLIDSTKAIKAQGVRFEPSEDQKQRIIDAPKIAQMLSNHPEYRQVYNDLSQLVQESKEAILGAGRSDNVALRGNNIEQIITQAGNSHGIEDYSRTLTIGTEVKIDIKTKILGLSSSPKGYNIDKALEALSVGDTVISFFFVGIDTEKEYIVTCLVSIFDKTILNATRIQSHWSGRNSRGTAQLSGDLKSLFGPGFVEDVSVSEAQAFLQRTIDMNPQEVKSK